MKDIRTVYCKIVFDNPASGNAAVVSDNHNHIASIDRTAEGTFKIYFTDKWLAFAGMSITRVKDGDVNVILLSEDVDNATAGSGYVEVAFQTAGSDADPDGETVHCMFWLHNSTVGRA
jgi:hypothetical protein